MKNQITVKELRAKNKAEFMQRNRARTESENTALRNLAICRFILASTPMVSGYVDSMSLINKINSEFNKIHKVFISHSVPYFI